MSVVRRLVAAVALVLIAVVHGADPVLCADGCTDEERSSASATVPDHDAPSTCLLCHSSIVAGSSAPTATPVTYARAANCVFISPVPTQPPSDIDHPPRFS